MNKLAKKKIEESIERLKTRIELERIEKENPEMMRIYRAGQKVVEAEKAKRRVRKR